MYGIVNTFDARLDLVPENPGVYLMKDTSGSVIYVGKAKQLKSRLRSYFTPDPKGTPKVLAMISNIADFEFIVCSNETEALLLECNLIKKFRPKYNILLMDDKEYPYIKITLNEEYPKVEKAYRIGEDAAEGAKYYGPYLNGTLKTAMDTLKGFFPVRNCNLDLPEDIGKRRPCLNHHIGKCPAPCSGNISREEYMTHIDGIRRFLEGKYEELVKHTEDLMKTAADELRFEKAAAMRDRLLSLRRIAEKQTVVIPSRKDMDVLGVALGEAESCIIKLEIREGRLTGNAAFFPKGEHEDIPEELQTILLEHYSNIAFIPQELLVPKGSGGVGILADALSALRGSKVRIRVPERGIGRELVEMAEKNALSALRRHTLIAGGGTFAANATLEKLSGILFGVPDLIFRIEAFDISNYGKDDMAASMVVFEDGRPHRAGYRLFRINGQDFQDDYSAMKQAVKRRFGRAGEEDFGRIPQLLLIDGGAGHVTAVTGVLTELDIPEIAVLGMVKDHRHRTRALISSSGDEIVLTADAVSADGLESEDRRNLLRLISGIQDEAHRFAGNYTKKLSRKRQLKFSLENIPGVGEARRKSLMKHFGSIRAVRAASPVELSRVEGISSRLAEEIYRHFHQKMKDTTHTGE